MPDSFEPFLTPTEIAKLLKVSPETVIGWIRKGELLGVNVGSGTRRARFRVSRESLDEFFVGEKYSLPPQGKGGGEEPNQRKEGQLTPWKARNSPSRDWRERLAASITGL